MLFSPQRMDEAVANLREGFARPGAHCTADAFEVIAGCAVVIEDDLELAADSLRPMLALYIGGMGAREANFHFNVFVRMGFEAEAHRIQELYLDGHKLEAAAAVPTSLVEQVALLGPKEKIRDELAAWKQSIATTLLISSAPRPSVDTLRTMAELVL
jgi:alkanesulfonate monooxygenase SsuD/methylene tetrahydromethanopterin reductase-like flavin-dependent oxidoreductase (luciferase family)